MEIEEDKVSIGHEATVSKIGDEQIFYLASRGIPEAEAAGMIVNGFIEPITKELADGIRRRDEPADPAADGGLGRLIAGSCP